MKNLEQMVENGFFNKVGNGLNRIRNLTAGKIAVYSLAGVLSTGLGYGCGSEEGNQKPICEEGNQKPICWDKTFGGSANDIAYSVQQTTDCGYIVAGYTESSGWTDSKGGEGHDAWILKLDSNGSLAWDKTFGGSNVGGSNEGFAFSIQQTNDLGYIVAGETWSSESAGGWDAWILKLDSNGGLDWDKTFGGSDFDYALSIQQTKDDGYIVASTIDNKNPVTSPSKGMFGGGNFWILKLAPNGELEWDKTFGGDDWDKAYSIQQTTDGGYIVAGYTESSGWTDSKGAGGEDAWVLKLDSNGELEWDKTYGGGDNDEAYSIQQTADLGYIVAGTTESKGAGTVDAWILKLDSTGNLEWDKTFGGSGWDWANQIQQTTDGGYIVAGFRSNDAWVFKLNSTGDLAWDKIFEGNYLSEANSIQQTTDGGYIVAGKATSKEADDADAWIFKLDPDGNLECK